MEKVLQSKTLKALVGDESPFKYFQLDGPNAAGASETAIIYGSMANIKGYIAAPEGPVGPEAFESTDMLIILEMKDEDSHKKVLEMMKDGFVEMEKDGKTVLKADGPGAPPWFARMDGQKIIIASEDYLYADPESIVSPELKKLIGNVQASPYYLVANLDGARDLLTDVSKMASAEADFMTKQYISLIDQVSTLEVSSDLDGDPLLTVRLTGHNEKENKQIKLKVDAAIGLLKGVSELGLAQVKKDEPAVARLAEELLNGLNVEQTDNATLLSLKRPMNFAEQLGTAVNAALGRARKAASKAQNMNKMRQVALSKHNYLDTYRKFPFDPELTTNLSWRVHVLPFIEEAQLAEKFDMDQKWSGATNSKLVGSLPDVFKLSNGAIVSFIKPKELPKSFRDIRDGTSNTIVFVENRKAKMTPWTKPEGVTPEEFAKMVADLEDGDSLIVAFYDGSVRTISNKISKENLLRLCNPSDGEIVEYNEIK